MHVYDLWSADGCSVLIVTKFVISSMQLYLWVEERQMLLNTADPLVNFMFPKSLHYTT